MRTSAFLRSICAGVTLTGFFLVAACGQREDAKPPAPSPMAPDAPTAPTPSASAPPQRACTMDAKVCPDGSSVGRTGPSCEFAPCPGAQR